MRQIYTYFIYYKNMYVTHQAIVKNATEKHKAWLGVYKTWQAGTARKY